jgi:Bacterial cadherin-like domain
MLHGLQPVPLCQGVLCVNHRKAGSHHPRRSLARFFRFRGQEFQARMKGQIRTILAAIAVGGLVLALVGCNGDDDNGVVISPPVALDDTATTNENTPVTINVLANDFDLDGGSLTSFQWYSLPTVQ